MDITRASALAFVGGTLLLLVGHIFFPKNVPDFLQMGVPRKAMTILVVGADINYSVEDHSQLASPARADTIMLIQTQPAHERVVLLSIPRDSFVEMPNFGTRKINAAYSLGGLPLLQKVVESTIGVHIDRYFIVKPNAIARIVNKMGGVRVLVDRNMDYEDHWGNLHIHLKPGWQWLNGEQLQGYLRFRHDAMGDIRRIERQQGFLAELASGKFRPRSVLFIPRALRAITEVTQTNLKSRELVTAANFARMVPTGNLVQQILPGITDSTEDGQSIWRLDDEEMRAILKKYFLKHRET